MMIDLHSHTTASDGQHTPTKLIQLASQAGITHLAVTDHDTVAGLKEAGEAARNIGLTLIPGIEVSAFIDDKEVHILGHFIATEGTEMAAFESNARKERYQRMEKMVRKLNDLGFPITMQQVLAIALDAQLGRPHLAAVLVELRYCATIKEAFDRFLATGKPGFVDRPRLPSEKAIELIQNAGGAATLAHPSTSKVTDPELEALANAGLSGIEVFRVDHSPSQRTKYLELAHRLNLVPTAGSDFHGEKITPDRHLGSVSMVESSLNALHRRAFAG
jgi:predicted metal-dependent phosphoesterase TrpH